MLGGSPLLQNAQNLWICNQLYTVAHTATEVRFSPFCLTLLERILTKLCLALRTLASYGHKTDQPVALRNNAL